MIGTEYTTNLNSHEQGQREHILYLLNFLNKSNINNSENIKFAYITLLF